MQFPPNAGKPAPAPDPKLKEVKKREERDPHEVSTKHRSAAHPGQNRSLAQVVAATPFFHN